MKKSTADRPTKLVMQGGVGLERSGWVRKKPSSHAKTAWRNAPIQKRYITSLGTHVSYYAKSFEKGAKPPKPNGSFDLRRVTSIRLCTQSDPSAPDNAIDLVVDGHHIAIDFGYLDERNAWLQMWGNAIPAGVMPPELADAAQPDTGLRSEFESLALKQQELNATHEDEEDALPELPAAAADTGSGPSEGPETDIKVGTLWKEGHRIHTWKKRHFRLTSWGNLKYFDSAGSSEPIDVIPLGGSAVFVPNSRRASYPHAFRLQLDVARGEKHKWVTPPHAALRLHTRVPRPPTFCWHRTPTGTARPLVAPSPRLAAWCPPASDGPPPPTPGARALSSARRRPPSPPPARRRYILSGESAQESQEWQQALLRFATLPPPRESMSESVSTSGFKSPSLL